MVENKGRNYKIKNMTSDKVLYFDYNKKYITPNIADKPFCMSQAVNALINNLSVSKIVFSQREDFIYDRSQTEMLVDLAKLLYKLTRTENILSSDKIGSGSECLKCYPSRYNLLRILVMIEMREDPVAAYFHMADAIKREEARLKRGVSTCSACGEDNSVFISTLKHIFSQLSGLELIKGLKPYFKDYELGSREIYKHILNPIIRPNFLYTKIVTSFPPDAKEVDSYKIEDSEVVVLQKRDESRSVYHIIPPEYKLLEEKYNILGKAREIIANHEPKKSEFIDPNRTREIFRSVEKDLLRDIFRSENVKVSEKELDELVNILLRYTIGFGVIEVLLRDPKIQDISINAPVSMNPVSIIHADYGECVTNIWLTPRDVESWATKLRLISGRSLDESNPVLDTELILPDSSSRVAVIQEPLSPKGLAYSIRRHRNKPWTLPLFIQNKMLTPLAAGLLDFIIQGGRTLLVAGTRSAGKTSLLTSLMVQIMRSTRIISCEDTLELPVHEFKKLGYDIQSMKVQSVITGGKHEISASDGIRTSLRLGDSSLIVGEVRSKEAKALYEAMRVGALANVVAGTIHGESPYAVFDRVVNDLGVPRTSFKATDLIVVCNPVKSASGLETSRRVVRITEIRKKWQEDPLDENAFVDLMTYNPETDKLEPTDALIQGESEIIKSIGSRIREWYGDFDAIWNNIKLKERVMSKIVDVAEKEKRRDILEAEFVVRSNDKLHKIAEEVKNQIGKTDESKVFDRWLSWFNSIIKEI